MTLHIPALSEISDQYGLGSPARRWYVIALAPILGVLAAFLIAAGMWPVILAVLAAPLGFVILHRRPLVGLLAWLFFAQFIMDADTTAMRMVYWTIHRALPPLTIVIIVVSSWLGLNQRVLPRLGWPELAMVGYLVATEFSIVYFNANPAGTTVWLYDRVFAPMCLYFIIRLLAPSEQDFRQLALIAFTICVAQSLIGMVSWVAPHILPSMWDSVHVGDRTVGSLENPVIYTTALAFGSLLAMHAGMNAKSGLIRMAGVGAFLLGTYGIFISFTRASWLGGLIGIAGLTFLYPGFMLRLFLIAALLIGGVGAALLADQLVQAAYRLDSEQSQESALSRLPIIYASIRMFEAKPLLGWGYGNFDRYDREFQGRVADLVNPEKDHTSHNLYLTILAEQGLLGISLFLAPVFWWLALSFIALPRMRSKGFWSWRLLFVLWLIVAHAFIVNNFFNTIIPYALGIWWIALGLIGSFVHSHLAVRPHDTRRLPFYRIPGIASASYKTPALAELTRRRNS
jgi:O-antigen ligase